MAPPPPDGNCGQQDICVPANQVCDQLDPDRCGATAGCLHLQDADGSDAGCWYASPDFCWGLDPDRCALDPACVLGMGPDMPGCGCFADENGNMVCPPCAAPDGGVAPGQICMPANQAPACVVDGDCPMGLVCVANQCVDQGRAGCMADADCPPGSICDLGICQAAGGGGGEACGADGQACPPGAVCQNGICVMALP
jgi:hypothetical protein